MTNEQRRKNAPRRALIQACCLWIPLMAGLQIELYHILNIENWYNIGSLCLMGLAIVTGVLCIKYHRYIPVREESILLSQNEKLLERSKYPFETLGVSKFYLGFLALLLFFFFFSLIFIFWSKGMIDGKFFHDAHRMLITFLLSGCGTVLVPALLFRNSFTGYELMVIPISEFDLKGGKGNKRFDFELSVAIYGLKETTVNVEFIRKQLEMLRKEMSGRSVKPVKSEDEEDDLAEKYNENEWTHYKQKYLISY